MGCIGNTVWMIFGGFFAGLGHILGGLLISLTIVGIPIGKQAIKLGMATMAPFGLEIVPSEQAGEASYVIINVIWAILFGWEIAVTHFIGGIILGITVVGIPFAKQHFKLIPLAMAPFGRELR
ncbi:MAG: YccF domain-containing protein [Chloroflexota bacterium]